MPSAYFGQQIVMFGRYTRPGKANLRLSGRISGEERDWTVPIELPERDERFPEIERLWALERIRDSDVKWLAPSHGPIFRNNKDLLNRTMDRVRGYLKMADFGTLADSWPLMDEWDDEVAQGKLPEGLVPPSA